MFDVFTTGNYRVPMPFVFKMEHEIAPAHNELEGHNSLSPRPLSAKHVLPPIGHTHVRFHAALIASHAPTHIAGHRMQPSILPLSQGLHHTAT